MHSRQKFFTSMTPQVLDKYQRQFRSLAMITFRCAVIAFCITDSCSGFIVYPKVLESRAEGGALLLHIHPGLILTLEKSSVLSDNLHFVSSSLRGSKTTTMKGLDLERNLYHDAAHMSSLIVEHVPAGVEVRGILSIRHRISPLLQSRSSNEHNAHVIEEIQDHSLSESSEGSSESTEVSENLFCAANESENAKVQREHVDVFSVETCVVVSENYTAAFISEEPLAMYIATMMNWVALPFTEMVCPRIKFQVNKIIKAPDNVLFTKTACGVTTDILKFGSNGCVCGYDAEQTINDTVDYINTSVADSCDIIYHLTSEELTLTINGTFQTEVEGLTTLGGACTKERFAVGEDVPHTYSGRITMAHEIGHLLGCDHDGCPTSIDCSPEYGNLMSQDTRDMQNKSKLSECCKTRIRDLVSKLPKSCLDVNTAANFTNKFYPGQNITDEEFCNLTRAGLEVARTYTTDNHECLIDCCWNGTDEQSGDIFVVSEEDSEYTTTSGDDGAYETFCETHHKLDGMECSENKTCYRGNCSNHNWTEINLNYHTLRAFP